MSSATGSPSSHVATTNTSVTVRHFKSDPGSSRVLGAGRALVPRSNAHHVTALSCQTSSVLSVQVRSVMSVRFPPACYVPIEWPAGFGEGSWFETVDCDS
jgi:hypothetical protein